MIDEQGMFHKILNWRVLLFLIGCLALPVTKLYLGTGNPSHIENISRVMSLGIISRFGIYICDSLLYYIVMVGLIVGLFLCHHLAFDKARRRFGIGILFFVCLSMFIAGVLLSKALITYSPNIDVWYSKALLKTGVQNL